MEWIDISALGEGPNKTAAIAAWVQSLYPSEEDPPVLVGGAAVELYTKDAYTTGDFDFVGYLPPSVKEKLGEAGFRRLGRNWINEECRIFLEFPGSALEPSEKATSLRFGPHSVLIITLEDLIVDRLASWTFWNSTVDAANAFLLLRGNRKGIDRDRLRTLAKLREVERAWEFLEDFHRARRGRAVPEEELARWAESALS